MVICLERDADLHMAQLIPLPLTVSCFSEIQIGFTSLVPAHPGSPGKRAVKRVCVCVCVFAVRSLSLVMSECSLSGHGRDHASSFYIVDLENFATASRQYTGDIHNSTVVDLFMTPIGQRK